VTLEARLAGLLRSVATGQTSVEHALDTLRIFPFDLGETSTLDVQRELRTGFPEVVLAERKSPRDVVSAVGRLAAVTGLVLATRCNEEHAAALRARFPDAVWHERARIVTLGATTRREGLVVVASGGTSDEPVAEEAALAAEAWGACVERRLDIGVAGLHRTIAALPLLRSARCVVVVAGMDGALPSVIAGLVSVPVIAVPTSVGYGASYGGLAALLAMLNACAPGVSVVNIDNGFGAGYLAGLINRG
jgi:NCAIR mutase (PurE)-related protein